MWLGSLPTFPIPFASKATAKNKNSFVFLVDKTDGSMVNLQFNPEFSLNMQNNINYHTPILGDEKYPVFAGNGGETLPLKFMCYRRDSQSSEIDDIIKVVTNMAKPKDGKLDVISVEFPFEYKFELGGKNVFEGYISSLVIEYDPNLVYTVGSIAGTLGGVVSDMADAVMGGKKQTLTSSSNYLLRKATFDIQLVKYVPLPDPNSASFPASLGNSTFYDANPVRKNLSPKGKKSKGDMGAPLAPPGANNSNFMAGDNNMNPVNNEPFTLDDTTDWIGGD